MSSTLSPRASLHCARRAHAPEHRRQQRRRRRPSRRRPPGRWPERRASSSAQTMPKRQQHAAAAEVADQVERRHRRLAGAADRVQRAGQRDVVDVVAGARRQRAVLAPAGHAAVDEPRVAREQHVRARGRAAPSRRGGSPRSARRRCAASRARAATPSGVLRSSVTERRPRSITSYRRSRLEAEPRVVRRDRRAARRRPCRRAACRRTGPGRSPRTRAPARRREVPWASSSPAAGAWTARSTGGPRRPRRLRVRGRARSSRGWRKRLQVPRCSARTG